MSESRFRLAQIPVDAFWINERDYVHSSITISDGIPELWIIAWSDGEEDAQGELQSLRLPLASLPDLDTTIQALQKAATPVRLRRRLADCHWLDATTIAERFGLPADYPRRLPPHDLPWLVEAAAELSKDETRG
jgi:hypothetical protein